VQDRNPEGQVSIQSFAILPLAFEIVTAYRF